MKRIQLGNAGEKLRRDRDERQCAWVSGPAAVDIARLILFEPIGKVFKGLSFLFLVF